MPVVGAGIDLQADVGAVDRVRQVGAGDEVEGVVDHDAGLHVRVGAVVAG